MTAKEDQPVHLVEDAETGDRFLVYGTGEGLRLDIQYEGDTLWMTQAQIGALFGRDRTVITRHIQNIFEDGELDEATCVQKMHTTRGRPAIIYNLDVIISVGYRASSKQATAFRQWATQTLVQFATKGFVIDAVRLKDPANADRVRELREIIRDIRASEANMFAELKQICAMCQDYDPKSQDWLTFYQRTQAKLIYAVTSQTPSEIVWERSDASLDAMGLTSWPQQNIQKKDVGVSKNYLTDTEIKELNRLTGIVLDIFEDQLDLGRLQTMAQAQEMLNARLSDLGRVVLTDGGSVKSSVAKEKAEREFLDFKDQRRKVRAAAKREELAQLKGAIKGLPKRP